MRPVADGKLHDAHENLLLEYKHRYGEYITAVLRKKGTSRYPSGSSLWQHTLAALTTYSPLDIRDGVYYVALLDAFTRKTEAGYFVDPDVLQNLLEK